MIDAARIPPREATEEMIAAVWIDKEDVSPKEIWQSMWDAAPASPSPDAGEVERLVREAITQMEGYLTEPTASAKVGRGHLRGWLFTLQRLATLRPAPSEEQVERAIKETRRYTTGALTREEHEDLVRSVARAILASAERP